MKNLSAKNLLIESLLNGLVVILLILSYVYKENTLAFLMMMSFSVCYSILKIAANVFVYFDNKIRGQDDLDI